MDHVANIARSLFLLETAQHYLDLKRDSNVITGGIEWKKGLHAKFPQLNFFPSLWSNDEIVNRGNKQ